MHNKTQAPNTSEQTEGWTEGQKDRRMDGQTLFYRTLPATAGALKRKKRREERRMK